MRRSTVSLVMALVVALVGVGPAGAEGHVRQGVPVEVVSVTANEYGFDLPSRIRGGDVRFSFTNDGDEIHEFALYQLDAGKTVEDVKVQLATGAPRPPWRHFVSAFGELNPGERFGATRHLTAGPGIYVFMCFDRVPPDAPNGGKRHADLGMIAGFEAVGDFAGAETAKATVTLSDTAITLPALQKGTATYDIRNTGSEAHGVFVLALEPGKSRADVLDWFASGQAGPSPAVFLGGNGNIPGGATAQVTETFERGVVYTFLEYRSGLQATGSPEE